MGLQLNFDGIGDPTKIHSSSDRPMPGRGMATITKWNEYGGAKGQAHELELEIVAWTDPGSVGKTHKENIFHKDTTGKGFPERRLTCLAMAAGLFNAADVDAWKRAGASPEIDFSKLVDRPIMIMLSEEPDKDDKNKMYLRISEIGLAFYHIKDPKTKDWPRNQGLYNRKAQEVGEWIVSNGAPPAENKPTPASGATSNPFAGKV